MDIFDATTYPRSVCDFDDFVAVATTETGEVELGVVAELGDLAYDCDGTGDAGPDGEILKGLAVADVRENGEWLTR